MWVTGTVWGAPAGHVVTAAVLLDGLLALGAGLGAALVVVPGGCVVLVILELGIVLLAGHPFVPRRVVHKAAPRFAAVTRDNGMPLCPMTW